MINVKSGQRKALDYLVCSNLNNKIRSYFEGKARKNVISWPDLRLYSRIIEDVS